MLLCDYYDLQVQQKYELLLEIANDVIEPLFIALVIPFIRPHVLPVVERILLSIQHTSEVFHKIVPRIPRVLHAIDQSLSQNGDYTHTEDMQKLVDITSALIYHYPVNDDTYHDLVSRIMYRKKLIIRVKFGI